MEFERLWPKVWQLAGLSVDLPEVGSYFTYELGNDSILVVRDRDRVRAFHNVCRHRGRALCEPGTGHLQTIRCPYHHWEWDLGGKMTGLPCAEAFPQIDDRAEVGLLEIACELWQGFVFVCFDREAPPLRTFLGSIGERVAAYALEEYVLHEDQTVEIECNWKVAIDASNESYHIPAVHPELLQIYDETRVGELVRDGAHGVVSAPFAVPSGRTKDREHLNDWLRQLLVEAGLDPKRFEGRATQVRAAIQQELRRRTDDFDFRALTDDQLTDYASYYFFPNVHLNVQGLNLNLSRVRPHASDPERMFLDQWSFIRRPRGTPAPPRPARERFLHGEGSLGFVTDQDTSTYVRVQRGMRSRAFTGSILGEKEIRIQWMHRWLDAYLAVEPGLELTVPERD